MYLAVGTQLDNDRDTIARMRRSDEVKPQPLGRHGHEHTDDPATGQRMATSQRQRIEADARPLLQRDGGAHASYRRPSHLHAFDRLGQCLPGKGKGGCQEEGVTLPISGI